MSGVSNGLRGTCRRILPLFLMVAFPALLPAPPQRGERAARPSAIQTLAFSPDGRLGALARRSSLSLMEVEKGRWKERWRTSVNQGSVTALDFSPDGTQLAAGITSYRSLSPIGQPMDYYVMIQVLDVETGRITRKFTQPEAAAITDVSFASDASLLAVVARGGDEILLWNAAKQAMIPIHSKQRYRGFSAAFTPACDIMALAVTIPFNPPKFYIRLYDTNDGQPVARVAQGYSLADNHALAFSPDGMLLAAGLEGWNPRDLRRTEIRLYDLKIRRAAEKINKIDFPIESLVFSEDGKSIAGTGFDRYRGDVRPAERTNRIGIWDVETGELKRDVETEASPNQYSAILKQSLLIPDQNLFALVGIDGIVSLYDTTTAKLTGTIGSAYRAGAPVSPRGSSAPQRQPQRGVVSAHRILGMSIYAKGRILAGSSNGTISAWDIRSGRILNRITLPSSVQRIALSPDAGIMAVADNEDGTVAILDASTGETLRNLAAFPVPAGALTFSPDGDWLAGGDTDGTIKIWRTKDWEMIGPLTGHRGSVRALAFSQEAALLASGGEDMTVRLWDPGSPDQVAVLQGHKKRVNALAFSADGGTLASAGDDSNIILWDVKRLGIARKLSGHPGSINSICFSPDGSALVSGGDESIRVWNAAEGKLLRILTERAPVQNRRAARREAITYHNEAIMAVAFSPEGNVLACGGVNNVILLWDAATWNWRLVRI